MYVWYIQTELHECKNKTVPIPNICYGHSKTVQVSFLKKEKKTLI